VMGSHAMLTAEVDAPAAEKAPRAANKMNRIIT
jgi:hypothetical protein